MSESGEIKPKSKSRHLPLLDLFETLQVEYLVAELRHKIYPKVKDKKYWKERVMDGKKASIEAIAEKNHLPTIFTDGEMLRSFEKKVYRDQSLPCFTYRDAEHEQAQSYWDLYYYYAIGSDVRVQVYDETKVGKITKEYIPYKDNTVFVNINGVQSEYPISSVTRIL